MLYIYRFLINITYIISPIIIIFRLFKKKNIQKDLKKNCAIFQSLKKGRLIWFHGASVGEIQSIIPL